MTKNHCGFSLMELLIALVIVGILSAIAVPTYNTYTKRAHYSEIVLATQPYKMAVMECFISTSDLSKCHGGTEGIPADVDQGNDTIKSIKINQGIITVTPNTKNGITETDTYILTPNINGSRLQWAASGGAVTTGLTR